MPGISLIYKLKQSIEELLPKINFSIRQLIHNDDFKIIDLLKTKNLFVAATKFENYPLDILRDDEFKVILEGKIYNKSFDQINKELNSIIQKIGDNVALKMTVLKFISETDGDYLLLIYDLKKEILLLFNDLLGRLPFYFTVWESNIIISREIRFLSNILENRDYDKTGIAQSLLFGYPLGKRTFIKNFNRVPPASLIFMSLKSGEWENSRLYDFNFEIKEHSNLSMQKCTDDLIDLLTESCKARLFSNTKNVLSLSGGLDSRALAIILKSTMLDFSTATYLGYKEFAEKDAVGAEEIARRLNLKWDLIKVGTPKGIDVNKLIKYKNGLNTLSSVFLLAFYEKLVHKFGKNMVYITGDGGDKIFPDHRPTQKIRSVKELASYLISNKYFFTPAKIERLLGIKEADIIEGITSLLDSYPEQRLEFKFERFTIVERGIKWLFEGEDRNRFFFWSVAPYYGQFVFNYAMNVSDNLKSGHKLYNNFLASLSPELLNIKNALWNVPADSFDIRFRTFNFLKDTVYPTLPSAVKRKLRMMITKTAKIDLTNHKPMNELVEKLSNNKIISNYFSVKELKKTKVMNKTEFYLLLTVLLAIDDIEPSESILDRYFEQEFI